MTQDMITLRTLLEKTTDAEPIREMIERTAEPLMALEVEGLTGTTPGERRLDRINHPSQLRRLCLRDSRRHGCTENSEAEEGELLPRHRPGIAELRLMAENALTAAIKDASFRGI